MMGLVKYNIYYSELSSALIFLQLINCISSFHAMPQTNSLSFSPDIENNIKTYDQLFLDSEADSIMNRRKSFGFAMSPPFVNKDDTINGKAYSCSIMSCMDDNDATVVCACNYNTGNVVTFKNSCDVKKHNCRFDTDFRIILNDICPWEFQSRRNNKQLEIDYSDPKYYN